MLIYNDGTYHEYYKFNTMDLILGNELCYHYVIHHI